MTVDQLRDTRAAFDAAAPAYAEAVGSNPVLEKFRERLLSALTSRLPHGAHLLDLGCGPGLDAERLAGVGYRVTAVDWSPVMVELARARLSRAGLAARVDVRLVGAHELDRLAPLEVDAAYSDLGPLNCVPDLASAARSLAAVVRPGGLVVASVMGRLCPWELVALGARGGWKRAAARFSHAAVAVPMEGNRVWTRYYWPSEFTSALAGAGFSTESLQALGLLVPPPFLDGFARRHPRLVRVLQALEARTAGWPLARQAGDHFLAVMRRR